MQFCEGDSHVLTCGIFKINILSANYGRLTGAQVCGWGPIKTTYCKANGALAKVQAHCQGRSHCTLRATNSEFGDPCYGTYKYLEVTYICQPSFYLALFKRDCFFSFLLSRSSQKKNKRSRSLMSKTEKGGRIDKPQSQNPKRVHLPAAFALYLQFPPPFFLDFPGHFSPFFYCEVLSDVA